MRVERKEGSRMSGEEEEEHSEEEEEDKEEDKEEVRSWVGRRK